MDNRIIEAARKAAVYVFDEDALTDNVRSMKKAFSSRYSNFKLAYSFKTNYLKPIIDTMKRENVLAEVVSEYEYDYAKMNGYEDSKIVYNGMVRNDRQKYEVALEHGKVNIDSISEYRAISQLAREHKTPVKIGIRVNFSVRHGAVSSGGNLVSRFGMDIESEEFNEMLLDLVQDRYVSIGGFHCHIAATRPAELFGKKAQKLIELVKKYGGDYIDLGGGMYGPLPEEIGRQYSDYPVTYDEYAEKICGLMNEAFPDKRCMLILEPGTALVGNTMSVVAMIQSIKCNRGQQYITLNCSNNHVGKMCEYKEIPIKVVSDGYGLIADCKDAWVVGNTCLEFDYIRKGIDGTFREGDVVEMPNTGAYSISTSRQFIIPRLAVFARKDGACIKNAETSRDMFRTYR